MSFLTSLLNSLPGAAAQGLIWGIMAIGVYITYRILDVADLTVDGSLATGANPNMARAQGINTRSNTVLGLMISNGLVAMAGALLAQYQGSSDINMGRGAIVIGLAAVIIGEVIFGKLFRNFALKMLAVSIGAIIYYFVLQLVLQLGLNTNDLKLITALIVAVFLAIPYWKGQMFHKKQSARVSQEGGGKNA